MLEKAEMRFYLKSQIHKIKQIFELRRLQILCKLRSMALKLAKKVKIDVPSYYPINFQISIFQKFVGVML